MDEERLIGWQWRAAGGVVQPDAGRHLASRDRILHVEPQAAERGFYRRRAAPDQLDVAERDPTTTANSEVGPVDAPSR